MEHIHYDDVTLVSEGSLDLQLPTVIEPVQLSVVMLTLIESLVLVYALLHLRGQDANGRRVSRPGSISQNFSRELDVRVGD